MRTSQPREELLAFFARMEAREHANRESTLDPRPSTELPFEPDPQHSCCHGSERFEGQASSVKSQTKPPAPSPQPLAPMHTDPVLIAAFHNKYPTATSIKVVRATLWERVMRGGRPLPIEVWVSLPNGTVVIEKRRTTEELLAIAEARGEE